MRFGRLAKRSPFHSKPSTSESLVTVLEVGFLARPRHLGRISQEWLARGRWEHACIYTTGKPVTKIWERLYLGCLKDAEQLARSNPRRIATVVSLCREQAVQRAPKIIYMHIPIPDSRPISAQKFEDIMFAIALGVRRGNLLVHCLQGMSRSPILIAAWMDRCGYAGIDKALSEIAKRKDLAPSRTLLASVQDLVRK